MSKPELALAALKYLQQILHDYRLPLGTLIVGWHMKQPAWMNMFSRKEEG